MAVEHSVNRLRGNRLKETSGYQPFEELVHSADWFSME
jgi:hypothetical protein